MRVQGSSGQPARPGLRAHVDAARAALLTPLRRLGPGAVGQLLALAAMLVPIVARRGEQLQVLVVAGSAAGLVVGVGTAAIQLTLPALRSRRLARLTVALATCTLTALCLVGALLLLIPALPRRLVLASVVILWTRGLYDVLLSVLVRRGDEDRLVWLRLDYGVGVVAATLLSLLSHSPAALALWTSLAYLVPFARNADLVVRFTGELPALMRRTSARLAVRLARRSAWPVVTTVLNGATGAVSGLATAGLGPYASAWAVGNRLTGGFVTTLLQVLVPPLEARIGRAVRTRDGAAVRALFRRGLLVGAAVAVGAMVLSVIGSAYVTGDRLNAHQWLMFTLVLTAFWAPGMVMIPVGRYLNFVGQHALKLALDAVRAAGLLACVVALRGMPRLEVMAALAAATSLLYYVVARRHLPSAALPASTAGTATGPVTGESIEPEPVSATPETAL